MWDESSLTLHWQSHHQAYAQIQLHTFKYMSFQNLMPSNFWRGGIMIIITLEPEIKCWADIHLYIFFFFFCHTHLYHQLNRKEKSHFQRLVAQEKNNELSHISEYPNKKTVEGARSETVSKFSPCKIKRYYCWGTIGEVLETALFTYLFIQSFTQIV